MATAIFQLITTATNVKRVEPRFTTLRIKKAFFPLSKLQPNSSIAAEGEAAGKWWVCPWQKFLWVSLEQLQLQRESCGVHDDDREPMEKTVGQDHVLKDHVFSTVSELLLNSRSTYSLNKCIHLFEQHLLDLFSSKTQQSYRTNKFIYGLVYYSPHSTIFLIHLQTQAFLGVLWQYFINQL